MRSDSYLVTVLDEIEEFLEDQQDVVDGSDGPRPNKAMQLLSSLAEARTQWARDSLKNAAPQEPSVHTPDVRGKGAEPAVAARPDAGLQATERSERRSDAGSQPCGVTYPHPPHDTCDGSPIRPWPFPLQQPKCGKCYDTGWLHGAQEWTPERMNKGTPYKSVRCDCQVKRRASRRNATDRGKP